MLNDSHRNSKLFGSVDKILTRLDQNAVISGNLDPSNVSWVWNADQDAKYSHNDRRFDNILHVFHKEWHGIRAAAGSLPGQKLAITEASTPVEQLNILALEILEKGPTRVVFHGFSHNMAHLITWLHSAGFDDRIFTVFHGSPAQWWNEVERKYAFEMIELAQKGYVRRAHIMKNGMDLPGVPLFKPLLYNMSPLHRNKFNNVTRADDVTAFVPGWGNWIKNVFGTTYGASLSQNVSKVWAFASGLQLPSPLNDKLVLLAPTNREETFMRYIASHLTLNVSLVDCHPMVNIESQSFGRPCVRSDLHLDAHEDHEYVKLSTVRHNNSPTDIRDVVDRVLSVQEDEIRGMVLDYQEKMDALSLERYFEFLDF